MANKYWTGAADDVKQVDTITVSGGPWTTGKSAILTCNNKTVKVTMGSSLTDADVAEAMAAAVNAIDATSDLVNDETRNRGGRELGEFRDFVATSSGAVLTLESVKAGVPFTVTASDDDASGVFTTVTSVTAATGKNHFDNSANWSGGTLPSASDVIIPVAGAADILYGLDNATLDLDLQRKSKYTGNIGLINQVNVTHSGYPYSEYRQRYLDLPVTATTGVAAHQIGAPADSVAVGSTLIDLGINDPRASGSLTVDIAQAQNVSIVGGVGIDLTVWDGQIDVGNDPQENATELETLTLNDGGGSGPTVVVGESVTFSNTAAGSGVIIHNNGTLTLKADQNNSNNEYRLRKGTLTVGEGLSLKQISMYSGRVDWRGLLIDNLYVYGGEFDATRSGLSGIATTMELYKGAIYRDPYNMLTDVLSLIGCTPNEVTLDLKANLLITVGDATSAVVVQ